ncbi:cytochrome P450 [Polyangium aurulentum]|uniref:cytochrome P450 n=1 Tax=Polyangium aurulentum TaxID=2567896 RepID=UPI0010AE3061|nr:cytochrome P450 [Polyangium aurulentum]UQA59420.1 cytochrome P450 [Polyangium aurulentum]
METQSVGGAAKGTRGNARKLADIRVLAGKDWTGHAAEFKRAQGGLFLRMQREVGDIGRMYFFNVPIVVLSSPELLHEAFVEKAKSFEKSIATKLMFYPFAGKGVFTSEGEQWRRQRRLMAPFFHPGAVRAYAPTMNEVITRCLDGWKDGQVIDAGHEMTRITMAVAGKVFFDMDPSGEADELSEAIRAMFDYLGEQSGSLSIVARALAAGLISEIPGLPAGADRIRSTVIEKLGTPIPWPIPSRRRVIEGVKALDRMVQRTIDERRRSGQKHDVLSKLLSARDEDDGSFMTDRQVRDEVITLFVAGHETTATGMTWSLYFLSRGPEAYRRWKDEVAALGGRTPTAEDSARLEYTRGVFKEAIRLYPPAFAFDRVAAEDVEIGGYLLPRTTGIVISPYAVHRRESIWPDPERFDPSRFSAAAEAARPRAAYVPFGIGPRVCIGASFAQLEAELLLAQLAQRFEFEAVDGEPIGPNFATALRPAKPVRLRVRVKPAAPSAQ